MNFWLVLRFCGILCLACTLSPLSLSAQSPYSGRLEVDMDALAIARGGYGVRLAYQSNHVRLGASSFDHRLPALVIGERNVSIRTSGIGFGADYYLRAARGIFLGLHTAFHEEELRRVTTEETAQRKSIEAGLQAGYRWSFGRESESLRGLFLESALAVTTRLDGRPLTLGSSVYETPAVAIQPTLRMGYRF